MRKLIYILFVALPQWILCQSIQPQVINSAGTHHDLGNISITDNVGEAFIQTMNGANFIVTQGFLQPDIVSKVGPSVSVLKSNVSCSDKKDGHISVSVSNVSSNFSVSYFWNPSSLCPGNDCSAIDSLNAGTYTVVVVVTDLANSKSDTIRPAPVVIQDANGPCKVKIYNGVTPNGDGENDVWIIENITEFPANEVQIYNRWGVKMFETKGYDNAANSWPPKNTRIDGTTYFYVINLGNGTPPIKGWVEVIMN